MVPGHQENVRVQFSDLGDERVQILQTLHLGVEISILSGSIGRLVMDEEKVVVIEVLTQGFHFVAEGSASGNHLHPRHFGQPSVHGIGCDSRRV